GTNVCRERLHRRQYSSTDRRTERRDSTRSLQRYVRDLGRRVDADGRTGRPQSAIHVQMRIADLVESGKKHRGQSRGRYQEISKLQRDLTSVCVTRQRQIYSHSSRVRKTLRAVQQQQRCPVASNHSQRFLNASAAEKEVQPDHVELRTVQV